MSYLYVCMCDYAGMATNWLTQLLFEARLNFVLCMYDAFVLFVSVANISLCV